MPVVKYKVFAYITHADRLLVFSHPFHPEAGLQVTAGTVLDGEHPDDAVVREAFEETGLADLTLDTFLGEVERDMSDFGLDEIHRRRFYHLRCHGRPPETWRHFERDPSDRAAMPIAFDFFWARLPDGIPKLVGDHDAMIPRLLRSMSARS